MGSTVVAFADGLDTGYRTILAQEYRDAALNTQSLDWIGIPFKSEALVVAYGATLTT